MYDKSTGDMNIRYLVKILGSMNSALELSSIFIDLFLNLKYVTKIQNQSQMNSQVVMIYRY